MAFVDWDPREAVKLGLGLYRHMLTVENLRFARQAGATHIVAHLVDYFSSGPRIPSSVSRSSGWGPTDRGGKPWTLEEVERIKAKVEGVDGILCRPDGVLIPVIAGRSSGLRLRSPKPQASIDGYLPRGNFT